MDFQDEAQVGKHTYGVRASSMAEQDGRPATVAVEFTGADAAGEVVAEGNLLISLDGLADANTFLARTLDGLSMLHGRPRGRAAGRAGPPNAGQSWTEEHSTCLRERWMQGQESTPAPELLGELAEEFGRSRGAVRAQLPRLGLDPDVPGRPLGTPSDS